MNILKDKDYFKTYFKDYGIDAYIRADSSSNLVNFFRSFRHRDKNGSPVQNNHIGTIEGDTLEDVMNEFKRTYPEELL